MKIHTSKLHQVLRDYMVQSIVPKLPNNFLQFGTAFVSNYISANLVAQYLTPHLPMLQTIGIIDATGMVDLDGMKQAALMAMEQCHGSFMIANYKADAQDIEELYNIATRYCEAEAVPPASPAPSTSEVKAI